MAEEKTTFIHDDHIERYDQRLRDFKDGDTVTILIKNSKVQLQNIDILMRGTLATIKECGEWTGDHTISYVYRKSDLTNNNRHINGICATYKSILYHHLNTEHHIKNMCKLLSDHNIHGTEEAFTKEYLSLDPLNFNELYNKFGNMESLYFFLKAYLPRTREMHLKMIDYHTYINDILNKSNKTTNV